MKISFSKKGMWISFSIEKRWVDGASGMAAGKGGEPELGRKID